MPMCATDIQLLKMKLSNGDAFELCFGDGGCGCVCAWRDGAGAGRLEGLGGMFCADETHINTP